MTTLSPQQFVQKWRTVTLNERAAVQEHFLDLCALIGHPTPAEDDPTGERFTFEAGVAKSGGGQGFADVWKRGYFAWEYKGKDANLDKAYQQLQQYREALQNPPLLIVSDIQTIQVHTNFTNTVKQVRTLTLDDLLTPAGMQTLRWVFYDPEQFRTAQTTQQVTEAAAGKFAELAQHLHGQGEAPDAIAHFLIRLLFCLFAEDIDLLPNRLFSRLTEVGRQHVERFNRQLRQLFDAMAVGDYFGAESVPHFNGGLFDDGRTLDLDDAAVRMLHEVAALDWSSIEPSIFGTLFERSLDPNKRSQLGAHYTSRDDILLIVEPVLMAPLRREWAAVQGEIGAETAKRTATLAELEARTDITQTARSTQRQALNTRTANRIRELTGPLLTQIRTVRVLDPACGSGNFLYVALRQLLDLEKVVMAEEAGLGGSIAFPQVSPVQLYGIELNEYAHELAQATVWIGYIQWLHDNGFGVPPEPILKRMDNIRQMDAILAFDAEGKPFEPEWPEAEVIVGNPPFLGGQRLRRELGDCYVDNVFSLYGGRVAASADLVCYWFEKARQQIADFQTKRVGLLATQSIRAGTNRQVLDQIKESGDIFFAWSDRPWVLDGASVRVSMVGFDNSNEKERYLDGLTVDRINPDLTSKSNLTEARKLIENNDICYRADEKGGSFDISDDIAREMLNAPLNVNGRPNSDVIIPWVNGSDVVQRARHMWIIDFGVDTSYEMASLYEIPFKYVEIHVRPERADNRVERLRQQWWLHRIPAADMRVALKPLERFIVTPRVARHRIFVFLDGHTLPDTRLAVFARSDDYFFGVIHSYIHEVWSLATSSRHGVGNDPTYNSTTCFETFPFPWPPGQEPTDDPRVGAIAQAAEELNTKREAWLNPPGLDAAALKKRTLTNLYNARPTWLDLAHKKLDGAVAAAYGWPADLADEEILARLLALNLARAAAQAE
jgi:type II restriction/modification system DNA methylase subunit YeeA